jgi:nucleoside-diphosphate-sugar epimerase
MKPFFELDQFINQHITKRAKSLLEKDLNLFNEQLSDRINNKSVLVIGGAGTIGASFIKAILKFSIKKLYVIDINENGLTELVRDLRSSSDYNIPDDFKTYPIDFGSRTFEKIFKQNGIFEIVANFAAHKHVRSEKDHYSIEAMIENNVVKAKRLLDLLMETPPERFFCVSTDKAANPVNVMGASKKLMEEVVLAYSKKIPITTARFANVAFSNGSLLLGYMERLLKKQPLSCPLNIERYFVSPTESGQICLMACVLGESGEIFFPKLDPIKDTKTFDEITIAFLRALGYTTDVCATEQEAREKAKLLNATSTSYPVYFFASDTSGEKSYEEFYTESEVFDLDKFPNLGIIKSSDSTPQYEDISTIIESFQNLFNLPTINKNDIVDLLKRFLPNFEHIEKGKSLDQKM